MVSETKPVLPSQPNYEKRIVRALRQLTQTLEAHSRQLLKGCDITVPQVMCMDELIENGAMMVSVLAAKIHVSPSTVVGIIDRLEKKGFVKRSRDAVDRRSVFVEITQEGRDFVVTTPTLLHNKLHNNLENIGEDEKVQIANALDLLVIVISKS